ncbi:serine acetyltransferase [Oligoflexia bacterium]|nr:serine acetyltransferase [Oligoflexia bacterium]
MVNTSEKIRILAEELLGTRQAYAPTLPAQSHVYDFADKVLCLLFPHFAEKSLDSVYDIMHQIDQMHTTLRAILHPLSSLLSKSVDEISLTFSDKITAIQEQLSKDAEAIYMGDPAAYSVDEVIFSYPGFYATAIYRIAHEFYLMGVPIFPRTLTEYAHQQTGVDIHPGAQIADSFCIDHATSVVIGETSVIGNNVKVYQGVTLGALSVEKSEADKKRHPTIEDNVVIYANATILGGATTIGHDSIIGGNVWLTTSVPPHTTVYHKSKMEVRSQNGENGKSIKNGQQETS